MTSSSSLIHVATNPLLQGLGTRLKLLRTGEEAVRIWDLQVGERTGEQPTMYIVSATLSLRTFLCEDLMLRLLTPSMRIRHAFQLKASKSEWCIPRQENSISYKTFLQVKIIEMIGILPWYNTMKCQLKLMSGTFTRYMLQNVSYSSK